MGRYFSCNDESAVSTCDPYNWDCKRVTATAGGSSKGRPPGAGRSSNAYGNKPARIRKFCHSELVAATGGFSANSFLGKGSHGSVYRAVLDGGRLTAAVKRAKLPAGGNFYENEIEILSRVRGPRLVNLIGVCEEDNESIEERLIVVEYMPNGCLYDLLHRSHRPPGWTDRVRFALQVARAVRGLHESEPPVIHRDIKSSNVLIDGKWNARLGDFGLALRGQVEDVRARSTPPAGTMGYLDPAYTAPGDLSEKSDVFSFGILLLEIISGRNAIDVNYSPPSIVDWAIPLIKLHKFRTIRDTRISPPADPAIMRLMAVLAAQCVRDDARRRPRMAEVVERLQMARERVRAIRVWGNLRQGTDPINNGEDVEVAVEASDEVGWSKKSGRKTRTRKVSNVNPISNVESGKDGSGVATEGCGGGPSASVANHQVVRSRSVGSSGSSSARRKQAGHGAAGNNKWAVAVRLSKSRSVGARLPDYSRGRVVFGDADCAVTGGNERSSGMIIKFDSDYEEESDSTLLEKPVVVVTVN
ncbi:serine/threonine-protein kinase-like protein At3g51990 [Punica granatum]|uniref:Uncharacterized protein n=2 Tax=Punica granatum TaxID=22663 RepID=A0A2I0KYK6_PUNGR|nr:serine/threonine-protein kinase-like protein At3g51990 [Punica granatum]PKI73549.1 hypothetical protein CRG98_006130 [Punica granatum]